ncbi:MAG TPA: bifunctional diaminohydroxyphosphoribosylaminopyrimidine deaminase/5-amino-6-(5-phosphoribosylamino)uracil reductase RibD [Tepidisphaeraceae bacterium]|nr:bifunctional diaminohydroxyphosphoribosylaminopyrimidine deaminase/5-amino-6-(5-phosphoribosylamino)uracil reductase RibD [Tepidisphaeraceae bacterium]
MKRILDEHYLRRAIRLAMNGRGRVEPNPMVGCVIVKNDRVIGEGYHAHFGGPHAEPSALANCTESPEGATGYVTLEPCCHTNKKTPPCAPRVIAAKIARVVVGCLDPNPQVNGNGVRMLRDAGIDVVGPMLEAEAKQLIAPFLARVTHHRPYVTLKWAESANGLVAGRMGRPVRITNATSDRAVHALRARCDAIAVGTNTVLNDDPLLTARDVQTHRPLLRVVLSNTLKITAQSRLVQTAREQPLLVFCSHESAAQHSERIGELKRAGAEVIALDTAGEGRFAFPDVLAELHHRAVTHLLIEPGPTLARALIEREQADRVWVIRSSKTIEDADGLPAAAVPYPAVGEVTLDGDRLTEYLNPASAVFFAPAASADFVLTEEQSSPLKR